IIRQERRALLFCQEDRAILCRECDIPIHQANEHTKKHNRFLLTGIKLSSSPSSYPTTASNSNSAVALGRAKTRPKSVWGEVPSSASSEVFGSSHSTTTSNYYYGLEEQASDSCSGSISEYLMETLPGWRVEDLLEDPSCVSYDDIFTNNNKNGVYHGSSSQYEHQGFWEQKPFS
ncbi:B-box zinc finger protein 20-like, partial [Raphanus sativus]|uniref:B-box zinc finger protein 20-like n=1 Tax=Raphanus sativus TaxID=3726 RepID=A0A9W3CT43_RAPSA